MYRLQRTADELQRRVSAGCRQTHNKIETFAIHPMGHPAVSVILPVYNGEQFLRSAVESVLNQTFQDYELIIIDDGSVDSTPAISREFGGRVKYLRQNNTGVAGAFNHGLRLATGRYISWLSHDDVFLSEKLEKQVSALDRIGGPAVCYTDLQMIDARGEAIVELKMPEHNRSELLRHVLTGGSICSASYSLMYDRRCIEEVGFYSEHWKYTQDVEMLMRMVTRFPLLRVPEVLVQVRDHAKRGISSKNWQREVVKFLREHLESTSLDELFPEGMEPGHANKWLGDALAQQSYPIYRVAYTQYRRALTQDPLSSPSLVGRTLWLAARDVLEILARLARFMPLLNGLMRRGRWKAPAAVRRAISPVPASKTNHT